MTNIKNIGWKEFMELDEVQVNESPSGRGNALFYNDGDIQVSVDFDAKMIDENGEVIAEGHDDTTLWEDEELAESLRNLVIEEMEDLK